ESESDTHECQGGDRDRVDEPGDQSRWSAGAFGPGLGPGERELRRRDRFGIGDGGSDVIVERDRERLGGIRIHCRQGTVDLRAVKKLPALVMRYQRRY